MPVHEWSNRSEGLTQEALGELYARYARDLLVFLTRRTFDAEVALDLMGETFAKAVLSRRAFRGKDEETARRWLFRIARRELGHYFERGAVERRGLERLRLDPPTAPEAELARVEELAGLEQLRDTIRAELERLSADQREVLRLRVVEELEYPAIAARLGLKEDAVRARVSRGLRAMAEALDRAGVEGVNGS